MPVMCIIRGVRAAKNVLRTEDDSPDDKLVTLTVKRGIDACASLKHKVEQLEAK